MKMLCFPIVVALMSLLVRAAPKTPALTPAPARAATTRPTPTRTATTRTTPTGTATERTTPTGTATTRAWWTTWWTTRAPRGTDLTGKMVTLTHDRGGIYFYPPSYQAPKSLTDNGRYDVPSRWTTAPPIGGVSVCLRYLTDSSTHIFTLSPTSNASLRMEINPTGYSLQFYGSPYITPLILRPNILYWPNINLDIWTRVCLTVNSALNVAQVFSGSHMSIRKVTPVQYAWPGVPLIDFSGFDGQLTDVQVWDYPLGYREVCQYMSGYYGSYGGSVLTWSSISYSLIGNTLLENTFSLHGKLSSRVTRMKLKQKSGSVRGKNYMK